MKNSIIAFLLVVAAITANVSTAQKGKSEDKGIKFQTDSLAKILAKAKSEGKGVFIDCYTGWCGPCKFMDKNVFINDTVGQFYNSHFVCVKFDMEKGEGIELAKIFEVKCYPTFLFLDNAGKLLHRACDGLPVQDFIKLGNEALTPDKQYRTFEDNYKSGNITSQEFVQYLYLRKNADMSIDHEIEKYFNTQTEATYTNKMNWSLIYNFVSDLKSPVFQYLLANREKFYALYDADSVNHVIENVYIDAMEKYIYAQILDTTGYKNLRADLIGLKLPSTDYAIYHVDMSFSHLTDNLWQFAKTGAVERNIFDNPMRLGEVAYLFYQTVDDTIYLERALTWSNCALEINSNCYDMNVSASLLYKLGRKEEAQVMEEKAIALAKKEGVDTSPFERILAEMKALKFK